MDRSNVFTKTREAQIEALIAYGLKALYEDDAIHLEEFSILLGCSLRRIRNLMDEVCEEACNE